MGIFSNIKINSLRKKIEGRYESRMDIIASRLNNVSEKERLVLGARLAFSLKLNAFAKIMNYSLFHPENGVFKNDIGNLNENNFDELYQIMIIWFSWTQIPVDSEGLVNEKGMQFCIESIALIFGINPRLITTYYKGLMVTSANLYDCAFYRWSILGIGHIDNFYDSLHENSPDAQMFIEIINTAKLEAEKSTA
jgi:hypothetical protein